ncbi:MAG: FtsW/RodA/SpoVE family cell cycle protein [Paenibacillaceae bacterium]
MLTRLRRIDWMIVLILLGFMGISYLLIQSAITNNLTYRNSAMDDKMLKFYGLGFVVMFAMAFINYRILLRLWMVIYVIGIASLVLVLKFAEKINGARSWFEITPTINFQPAELMKLFLIIAIAGFIGYRKGETLRLGQEVLPIGLIVLIPFVLVLIQPDLGNAMIYLIILLGMLWVGNVKYTHVLIGTAIAVGCFYLLLSLFQTYHEPISDYLDSHGKKHWMERIDTFIDKDAVSQKESYHLINSQIAIGSGGLLGDGFKQGNSLQNGRIPYAFSDSVFVVIGEEFGFVGSSALLLLYFLLVYRMILIAIQCNHLSGSLIITGIVSMLVFQIFQNVGMFLGILPITGITLPFISYGGTSLLINMLCIGIVQSIRVHQEQPSTY